MNSTSRRISLTGIAGKHLTRDCRRPAPAEDFGRFRYGQNDPSLRPCADSADAKTPVPLVQEPGVFS